MDIVFKDCKITFENISELFVPVLYTFLVV